MKKLDSKKTQWQSLLSLGVLGICILLAVGSSLDLIVNKEYPKWAKEHVGDGVYMEVRFLDEKDPGNFSIVCTQDKKGRWHGYAMMVSKHPTKGYVEEVQMVHGKRHGVSRVQWDDGTEDLYLYNMGNLMMGVPKSAANNTEEISAFQVLSNEYPWFLYTMNACDFEDAYIQAYMDTIETVLETYDFDAGEFNSYFQDVINELEETPYDSVINLNLSLRILQGLDEIKNDELRLAVIDRYLSEGKTTYGIVEITYPGYLLSMKDAGVSDQDFEEFCQELDSLMTADDNIHGSIDLNDPFFIDSVDIRMLRALVYIDSEKSHSSGMSSIKRTSQFSNEKDFEELYKEVHSILRQFFLKSSPSDVVEAVGNIMVPLFDKGDIIKQSVRKAYCIKKGVILVPTVTTEFSCHISPTSVILQGYVMEDGGGEVTEKGIAWAGFHNPTLDANSEVAGSGTGEFSVTLTDLTEGETYYARSYATNSAGTAYGNCVEFVAATPSGNTVGKAIDQDFNIYPNPASANATYSFCLGLPGKVELTIADMNGRVVYRNETGILPSGVHRFTLDLSGLQNGVYHCLLTCHGNPGATRKLIIAH